MTEQNTARGENVVKPGAWKRWKGLRRRTRWAVLAGMAVALYLFVGFVVVPLVVESVLPDQASAALGRAVTLENASFNPLTQELVLEGLAVAEAPGLERADAPAPAPEAEPAQTAATDGAAENATRPEAEQAAPQDTAARAAAPEPFVSVDRIVVNASSFSLLRLAVLVDEVRLTGPRVRIERLGPGRYNFSDILEHMAGGGEARESARDVNAAGPFPLVVNNFVIEGGAVTFKDRPLHETHAIRELDLAVPFASTLPGDAATDVTPRLRAVVDGTVLAATGRTLPFDDSLRSAFDLRLDGLDLAQYAAYLPLPGGARLVSGLASLDLALGFARSGGVLPDVSLSGKVLVEHAALAWAGGAELAGFDSLSVDLERVSLVDGLVRASLIRLEGPRLAVIRGRDGTPDVLALAPPPAAGAEPEAEAEADADAGPAMTFEAARVEISGGRLSLRDLSVPGGFTKTVAPVALTVDGLSTAGGPAAFALTIGPEGGERVTADGTADLAPLSVNATVALSGLDLTAYAPYYASALPLRLDSGVLGAGGGVLFHLTEDGAPQVQAKGLYAGLAGLALALPGAKKPALTLASLDVAGGSLDLAARRAVVQSLTLDGGSLAARRMKGGDLDLLAALAPQKPGAAPPAKPATTASGPPAGDWTATLEELALTDWRLRLADQSLETPAELRLALRSLTVGPLAVAPDIPLLAETRVALDAVLGKAGRLKLASTVRPPAGNDPGRAKGTLALTRLALADFSPYAAEYSALTLDGGALSLSGDFDAALAPTDGRAADATFTGALRLETLAVGAEGHQLAALDEFTLDGLALRALPLAATLDRLALAGLAVRDQDRPEDALNVVSLTVLGAALDLGARSLTVADVALGQPIVHVALDKDAIANLARIAARATGAPQPQPKKDEPETDAAKAEAEAETAPAPVAEPVAAEAAQNAEPAGPFSIDLGHFALTGGAVRFTDESLSPAFSTALEDIGVDLTGLSTTPGARATLAMSATMDGHAPFTVQAETSPTDIGLNPDARLNLAGLDLTHLSPYALKYIAHPITAGKLFADIRIAVDQRDVLGENKLRLARFDIGPKQKVEGAINAPVGLALALLRDGNGDVILDVPVRGNLDDPEFGLGRVVFRAIMNLLVKAVTSPFALIGSLFGGGGEDLDALTMPPGRATLTEQAQAKLGTVAKAMAQRPGLNLELRGVATPADLPALTQLRLARAVRLERYNELKDDGQAPPAVEDVRLTPEEYLEALTTAYEDAPFEKPTNALGFVKEQPVPTMEAMLRQHLAPTEADLPALALERARLARDHLLESGVDPARLSLAEDTAPPETNPTPGVHLLLQ